MGTNLGTNEKDRITAIKDRINCHKDTATKDRITAIKRIGYCHHLDRIPPSKEVSLCQKNRQESVLPTTSWCPKTFFCCANFMTEFNVMYTKEFFVSFLTQN